MSWKSLAVVGCGWWWWRWRWPASLCKPFLRRPCPSIDFRKIASSQMHRKSQLKVKLLHRIRAKTKHHHRPISLFFVPHGAQTNSRIKNSQSPHIYVLMHICIIYMCLKSDWHTLFLVIHICICSKNVMAMGHLPLVLQAWKVPVNPKVRWTAAPCCHQAQFPGSSSRRGSNRLPSRTSKSDTIFKMHFYHK